MYSLCRRVVAVAVAIGLISAFTVRPAAAAEPVGIGTSTASTTILGLELGNAGSLLNLRILGDDAQSTINNILATPLAFSQLVPASLTSQVLPVLNGVTANLPKFESRTPGGQGEVSGAAVDLSKGNSVVPVPGLGKGLLSGAIIPVGLSSALDALGARSALKASLANLSVVSGLLTLKSVDNTLATSAAPATADGNRAVAIDALSVLNLADLLKGLGIDLANLPLATLSNLLSTLGLAQLLPTGETSLLGAVTTVQGAIANLTQTLTGSSGVLTELVKNVPVVSGLLGTLPTQLPVAPASLLNTNTLLNGTVAGLLATLQSTLTNLLGTALGTLGNLSLLKLDGAVLSAVTKATSSLSTSKADVTGKLGGLTVLGQALPGLDLLSIADTINTITGTLTGVLGLIDPALANLIKVSVLDKVTNVAEVNGYNRATAGIDVLKLQIAPLADLGLLGLAGILNSSPTGALKLLGGAGVANPAAQLPVLGGGMGALNGLLNVGGLLGALTGGATLRVGSVQSVSDFQAAAPAPAPAPAPGAPDQVTTLPRTGGDGGQLGGLAAVLVVLSLVTRRFVRRTAVTA